MTPPRKRGVWLRADQARVVLRMAEWASEAVPLSDKERRVLGKLKARVQGTGVR